MVKDVVCDVCGEIILTVSELEASLEDKQVTTPARCPKCGNMVKVVLPSKKAVIKHYKKSIPCPVCGSDRLIDTSIDTRSELIEEGKMPSEWKPDYYQKCRCCKKEIGIRKIS